MHTSYFIQNVCNLYWCKLHVSNIFVQPDIAAPGVNILAAWSPKSPPSQLSPLDTRSVNWNFQSGTSMACPHVSGIVALLKSAHPDWSPAAIKSALMTTGIYNKFYTLHCLVSQNLNTKNFNFSYHGWHEHRQNLGRGNTETRWPLRHWGWSRKPPEGDRSWSRLRHGHSRLHLLPM